MTQLESEKEAIAALGAHLAYIAAEKRKGMWNPEKFLAKHPISSPFLLDENREVTKAYGLHHRFGHDAINIAHPATLVIDRGGTVRWIYRGDNQHDRSPIEDIFEALQRVAK
jgi:peroxiredoxin